MVGAPLTMETPPGEVSSGELARTLGRIEKDIGRRFDELSARLDKFTPIDVYIVEKSHMVRQIDDLRDEVDAMQEQSREEARRLQEQQRDDATRREERELAEAARNSGNKRLLIITFVAAALSLGVSLAATLINYLLNIK